MTAEELIALVESINYKPGYWVELVRGGDVGIKDRQVVVRIGFERQDVVTGEWGTGYGGLATIPADATRADVVRLVFGLFRSLEEHECREWFTVDGVQVFSPHITYEALLEAGRHIQGRDHG